MKRNIFLLIIIFAGIIILNGCSTYTNILNADSNIKRLEIGMPQEKAVSIMGDTYEIVGKTNNSIVLGYQASDGIYKLYFEENKLIEWNKEFVSRSSYSQVNRTNSSVQKDNTALKHHMDAHRNAMLSGAKTDAEKTAINAHMDAHTAGTIGH